MKKFLCIFRLGKYHTINKVDYTYVYRRLFLHTQFNDTDIRVNKGLLNNKYGKY